MRWRPGRPRGPAVFSRVGLDKGDQVLHGRFRYLWMDCKNLSCGNGKPDRVEVRVRIIGNLPVEAWIRHIADLVNNHQGMPISRRPCCPPQSDVATVAWHVLDVKLLS